MPVPIDILPGEVAQLLFVGTLVAFSVLVGQSLYEYTSRIDRRIEKKITDRKHPDIRHVLFHILWAPVSLLTVVILMRIGIIVLPRGSIASFLTALLDVVLVATLFWFAVRIIGEVIQLAETDADNHSTEA